jgi:hypothetical protein
VNGPPVPGPERMDLQRSCFDALSTSGVRTARPDPSTGSGEGRADGHHARTARPSGA